MPSDPSHPFPWRWDATRYKRAFLFGQVPEDQVQGTIVSSLKISYQLDLEVVDAGGAMIRGKFYGAMLKNGIAKALASLILKCVQNVCAAAPGRSDLSGTLAPDGRSVYIEVKAPAWINPATGGEIRPAGKPTPEQLAFLDNMHRAGAIVGVAWSLDDAIEIIGAERLAAHRRSITKKG